MIEWILIITMNLISQPGEIRDISPQIINGFASKKNCDAAAVTVAERLIALSGKAREQQGIQAILTKVHHQ